MSDEQKVRFVYKGTEYEVPQQPDWDNQLIVLSGGLVVCALETLESSPKRPTRIVPTEQKIDPYTLLEPDTLSATLASLNAVFARAVGPAPAVVEE
ncbi:MAG: hypothetical protein HZA34_01715 [Candidatus Pacebacteria bacterium]|nr:hypothetical protein [Candidatus Paceibacterota bacterium]